MADCNEIEWDKWVYYDEASPTFLRWKVDRYGGKGSIIKVSGSPAGGITKYGYTRTKLFGSIYFNHRIIWTMLKGTITGGVQVDHIDGCRSNNIIDNLRLVSPSVNSRNMSSNGHNSSGVVGVRLRKDGYYSARWNDLNGKQKEKLFSISKLGEVVAFELAREYRKQIIEELNDLGAGYTERHGTIN